jgi:uncharacterized protein YecE (DUF72 family)
MPSTRFHIGAKALRGPITAYAKRFDLLEVPVGVEGEGRKASSDPNLATLRRWRKSVPPHFTFSVVAGPAVGRLKPGEGLERELSAARAAVDALEARCLVVRTPMEVTPSALWKDRMAKLVARFPRDATHVVWEPGGVWETGEAAVAAKSWGAVLAVDASREPVPAGSVAYVRLRALGETRSFGSAALERVARSIGSRRDAFVIIETDTALEECKRLRRLAQRPRAAELQGGMGRLVRPRGGIAIGDDEQE